MMSLIIFISTSGPRGTLRDFDKAKRPLLTGTLCNYIGILNVCILDPGCLPVIKKWE